MCYKKLQRQLQFLKKIRARAIVRQIMGIEVFVEEKLAMSQGSLTDPIKGVISYRDV